MSDENKIQNEEELWDLLSEPMAEGKTEKPVRSGRSEGKFSRPRAAKATAAPPPSPVSHPSGKKPDGFFLACMAGVAAASVAVTLLATSLLGGGTGSVSGNSGNRNPVVQETVSTAELEALERENAELRAQLEQQKQQIKDLQADLLQLMGSEEYLATAPSGSGEGGSETIDAQVEAYRIFAEIQEAYAEFDRERLEELIPEMDERLGYLSSDALNSYYKILEYVEQPSNG